MNLYIYDKIRDSIKPGYQIVFSGDDTTSDIIKSSQKSAYSHCGTVISLRFADELPSRLFLIESTILNPNKDFSDTYKKGIQMALLSQRLESYDGQAWILPLKEPLKPQEQFNMVEWLLQRYGSESKYSLAGAISAGIKNAKVSRWLAFVVHPFYYIFFRKATLKKFFCSELSVRALQVANRIDPLINASMQTPGLLSQFSCFSEPISLTGLTNV